MLNRIRDMLRGAGEAERPRIAHHSHDELRIAAAALMVQAAAMDGHFGSSERETIAGILRTRFDLSPEECDELLEVAEDRQAAGTQLLRFTQTIKSNYPPEERIEIIEMLWEVAYADGVLHDFEAHLLRRVSGLIYVSDRERGEARQRVLKRLKPAGG